MIVSILEISRRPCFFLGQQFGTMMIMQCQKKYIRVDKRQIGFLKFIFEAYDGIANLTTIDAALGIISINIPAGCNEVVDNLLKILGRDILIESLEERG